MTFQGIINLRNALKYSDKYLERSYISKDGEYPPLPLPIHERYHLLMINLQILCATTYEVYDATLASFICSVVCSVGFK